MAKNHIVEKDGLSYRVEEVRHEGKVCGLAPTLQFDSLQEMIDVFTDDDVLTLALRQYREESKNKVRAKFNKEKVPASTINKAILNGEVNLTGIDKLPEKERVKAVIKQLGLGKESKADPTKIHWDIL